MSEPALMLAVDPETGWQCLAGRVVSFIPPHMCDSTLFSLRKDIPEYLSQGFTSDCLRHVLSFGYAEALRLRGYPDREAETLVANHQRLVDIVLSTMGGE